MARLFLLLFLCVGGCVATAGAVFIGESGGNSTSVEGCSAVLKAPNVFGCSAYDVTTRFCEEESGPAEIIWGPHSSPRALFFKTNRVECQIQTIHPRQRATEPKDGGTTEPKVAPAPPLGQERPTAELPAVR